MKTPTGAQIASVAQHVGSYAAGAVTMFGFSKAIDPDQLRAAADAIGQLGQDIVKLIGILTPMVAMFMAWRNSSARAQIAAVAAMPDKLPFQTLISAVADAPGVQRVTVSSQALADASPANVVTPADVRSGAVPPLTATGA